MATKLGNAQKGQLSDQLAEVYRVTSNGTRDFSDVRKALQDIIEGKVAQATAAVIRVPAKQSSWYVSPERQLEHVKQLNTERGWGFKETDFPPIPGNAWLHMRRDEVLLLAVYLPKQGKVSGLQRTFDELWNLIEAPDGYTNWRWDELKSDSKHLKSAPGHSHRPGVCWVAFDASAYRGKSPEHALARRNEDNTRLAGVEVLMAALLFPTWPTSWNGDSSPFPNMSGLQFYWNTVWSRVPYLGRWDDDSRLELNTDWAEHDNPLWASPSVREC